MVWRFLDDFRHIILDNIISSHSANIFCLISTHSRNGWGYCQLLVPEWEELATKVKGFVKIAYWDTEKSGPAPQILGQIQGTPTIKLIRPKRKAKTNKQKDVVDYNMERKADDSKWLLFAVCVGGFNYHVNRQITGCRSRIRYYCQCRLLLLTWCHHLWRESTDPKTLRSLRTRQRNSAYPWCSSSGEWSLFAVCVGGCHVMKLCQQRIITTLIADRNSWWTSSVKIGVFWMRWNFCRRKLAHTTHLWCTSKLVHHSLILHILDNLPWCSEFRRRVLIAQIPFTKKENKNIFFEYGVRGKALLVVPPAEQDESGEDKQQQDVAFDGRWNLHRLQSFFSEHALKSEVKPKPQEEPKTEDKEQAEPEKKEKIKTEL